MPNKDNINFIYQLNNKSRANNYFVLFIVSGVVFIGLAFFFVATNRNLELILNILLAVLYFLFFGKIKPTFFEMLVTETAMQINFYSVFSAVRNYQSMELGLNQLSDFHLRKSFFGLRTDLIVSVKSKYGLADYPPVSLTLLTKDERTQILYVIRESISKNQDKS